MERTAVIMAVRPIRIKFIFYLPIEFIYVRVCKRG